MKKLIALILCIATVFSMVACGNTAQPEETELGPEVVEKKDYSKYAGIVADPKTWYEDFMALPVANANMSSDELRQLCVDAFKANMSFHWTPNEQIVYTYELLDRYSDVVLPVGIAYSGLFYATGVTNTSRGNIYKMLNYYDRETGVLDIEAMGDIDIIISNMSSACAAGAQQAWNRISGSHGIKGMQYYNMYDSNCVPVGSYTYEPKDYNHTFGSRTASNQIIEKNGTEVMYESLAQMLPADGLYSSSSWHVMMCSSKPVVVRLENGQINPFESYMLVCEQGAGGTKSDSYNQDQSNGKPIRMLGTIDKKYTFEYLISKGYIPFTIKEFIGEDPIEPGEAWLAKNDQKAENGADLTILGISAHTIYTNYNLCTMKVEVKAPDGTVLVSYAPMVNSSYNSYDYPMMGLLYTDRLTPYANGKNTIHIYAQLANGELIEAFNTILKAD